MLTQQEKKILVLYLEDVFDSDVPSMITLVKNEIANGEASLVQDIVGYSVMPEYHVSFDDRSFTMNEYFLKVQDHTGELQLIFVSGEFGMSSTGSYQFHFFPQIQTNEEMDRIIQDRKNTIDIYNLAAKFPHAPLGFEHIR